MEISGYMQGKKHFFPVRVYYSDTDAGGVVYHAKYLDFAEHARTEMLRCAGMEQQSQLSEGNTGFIVQSLSITYHKPSYLDDLLMVETTIVKRAVFSLVMEQVIKREGDLISSMQIRVGHVSLDEGKPVPIPPVWREVLA